MIFTRGHAQMVLEGRKWQTRRVANGVCRYRVGADYSVQPGRTSQGIGRILVFRVHRQRLGDISHSDVQAEGYSTLGDFRRAWAKVVGEWDEEQLVDAISFRVVSTSR